MLQNLAGVTGVGDHPDIAVRDKVLTVATTTPDNAQQVCSTVAALTNDPDTAKPLGVIGIIVISGGQKVAECRP